MKHRNNQKTNKRKEKQKRGEREIKEKFVEERVHRAPPIVAKTQNQKGYLGVLRTEKLIVCRGPSGCGKTWIPASLAGDALVRGEISKIILARPYVALNNKTSGFLPGDLFSKLEPYLKPMLSAIEARMGKGAFEVALSSGQVEVQALESIRGRSFDGDVVVLLDESQNTTKEEIRSIVTRIGEGCQMIFAGDTLQHDMRGVSGLDYLVETIERNNIPDTAIVDFTEDDIVRSSMVKDFVVAFRKEDASG